MKRNRGFIVLIVLVFVITSCDKLTLYFDSKKATLNNQDVVLFLPTGIGLDDLADSLLSRKIIDDKVAFYNVARYKQLDEADRLAAGKYIIKPGVNVKALLNGFTKNSLGNGNAEVEVDVTFNNCRDVYQLAAKVAQHLELDSADLVDYIHSQEVLNNYGFTKERIGALFLPDTYRMYWDTDPETFVNAMAKQFKTFWNTERMAKLADVGLSSQSDAVTLASVVYKEQDKHKEEWPTIASLYLNRLRKGWLLQSDPTFRFCWGDALIGVKRLTYEHRSIDCKYNTYIYAGLPPGPICIPPAQVVDAVLNPAPTNYMFMCAKPDGDGLHNFAKTTAEHNKNAKAYQAWLTKMNIR